MSVASNNTSSLAAHPSADATPATNTSSATDAGVVIIGAGLAGWGVVDAIRSKDQHIAITLITADSGDRYHKPMLTMAISQNKTPADLIRATGAEAAQAANITLLAQHQVTDIDSAHKQITMVNTNTHTKEQLGYSSLVLAMGAHPAFPKSLPEELVWHVNHIERFAEMQTQLASGPQKLAIIGAGMVGTEIAEDLLKAGHEIYLVDLNNAPLAQMLPEPATSRIKTAILSQGIHFLGGCMVTSIAKQDNGQIVVAYRYSEDAGEDILQSLTVDHVIVSTGLLVNPSLPESAGIEYDRRSGIVVDERTLQTTQAGIYAIGDCMSIGGIPCRYVAPLRAQAATIADAIVGVAESESEGYTHKPPMIRLKNKAISVTTTGTPLGNGNWQTTSESEQELLMQQLDANGQINATLTIKSPS